MHLRSSADNTAFNAVTESVLSSEQHGHCGTGAWLAGDCWNSTRGVWPLHRPGFFSLANCTARCEQCQNCNYVSFSQTTKTCSWYQECPRLISVCKQAPTSCFVCKQGCAAADPPKHHRTHIAPLGPVRILAARGSWRREAHQRNVCMLSSSCGFCKGGGHVF